MYRIKLLLFTFIKGLCILYPALDPSIFEVKYPNIDIQGKVVGDNLASGD